jgi:sugar lactone lactonase YvrE
VEFLEPVRDGNRWKAIWRGCVESRDASMLNDVAATPDGGFVVTAMFSFSAMKADPHLEQLLDGRATGHLLAWKPAQGLHRLAASEAPAPNGVQVSRDGQSVWFSAWTGNGVWQYDLQQGKVVRKVALDFLPDNLSWTLDGHLLTAGVPDVQTFRRCFLSHDEFCPSASVVALIDPQNGTSRELLRLNEGVLYGASAALQVGRDVFVGAFAGDRLLLLPDALPEP